MQDFYGKANADAYTDIANRSTDTFNETMNKSYNSSIDQLENKIKKLKNMRNDIGKNHNDKILKLDNIDFTSIDQDKYEYEKELENIHTSYVEKKETLKNCKSKLNIFKIDNSLQYRDAIIQNHMWSAIYILASVIVEVLLFVFILKFYGSSPLSMFGILFNALLLGVVLASLSISVGFILRGIFHVLFWNKTRSYFLLGVGLILTSIVARVIIIFRTMEINGDGILNSSLEPLSKSVEMALSLSSLLDLSNLSLESLTITVAVVIISFYNFYIGFFKLSDIYPGYSQITKDTDIANESVNLKIVEYTSQRNKAVNTLIQNINNKIDPAIEQFDKYSTLTNKIAEFSKDINSIKNISINNFDGYFGIYEKRVRTIFDNTLIININESVEDKKESFGKYTQKIKDELDLLKSNFKDMSTEFSEKKQKLLNQRKIMKLTIKKSLRPL